jgi:hypothetical protein
MDPSVHKIYHHLPLQDPPKFTQFWIFGLKKTIWQPFMKREDLVIQSTATQI